MYRWIEYDRDELYRRVWSQPMSQLAEEEGISDRGLAKICARLDIPRPPRGYWAKVQAGRSPRQKKLPARKPDVPQIYRRRVLELGSPELEQEAQALLTVSRSAVVVDVADELATPHRLLARELRRLNGEQLPRGAEDLDIRVQTPCVLDRAVRVMDAVLRSIEAQGYEVRLATPPQAERTATVVQIMGVDVSFGLDEQEDIIKTFVPYTYQLLGKTGRFEYTRAPNRKLALKIRVKDTLLVSARRTWADGAKQRVEGCIDAFIQGLIQTAGQLRQAQQLKDRWQQEREASQRATQLAQARQAQQRRLHADLDARVQKMRRAQDIHALIEAIRTQQGDAQAPHVQQWLAWAAEVARQELHEAIEAPLPHTLPLQLEDI